MVSHVTLPRLHWVSVFLSVLGHTNERVHTNTEQLVGSGIHPGRSNKKNLISDISTQRNMSLRDICSCTLTNMLFIIAQNSVCSLCSGTTQDIPAGFYQPEFQDTAS